MRFALLGSGSKGNALVVEYANTRLLIDCGFSAREMERRLARLDGRDEVHRAGRGSLVLGGQGGWRTIVRWRSWEVRAREAPLLL